MASIDINSFTVAVGALIAPIFSAIFVERHYVGFWIGFWNAVALILAGIAALLTPVTIIPLQVIVYGYLVPLWAILVAYGAIILLVGLKINEEAIRIFGGSSITASILLTAIIAQYFRLANGFYLLLIVASFLIVLELIKHRFMQ